MMRFRRRLSPATFGVAIVLALSYLLGLTHLGDNVVLDSWLLFASVQV